MGSEWALKTDSPSLQISTDPFTPCATWGMLLNLIQLYFLLFQQELPIPTFLELLYILEIICNTWQTFDKCVVNCIY